MLFSRGINFDKLPLWQKRGVGIYWEEYEKSGLNPVTGQSETALRRRLKVDGELPLGIEYAGFIKDFTKGVHIMGNNPKDFTGMLKIR